MIERGNEELFGHLYMAQALANASDALTKGAEALFEAIDLDSPTAGAALVAAIELQRASLELDAESAVHAGQAEALAIQLDVRLDEPE